MATSARVFKGSVFASEITTEFIEDIFDNDTDLELDLDFSDNELNVEEANNIGTVIPSQIITAPNLTPSDFVKIWCTESTYASQCCFLYHSYAADDLPRVDL